MTDNNALAKLSAATAALAEAKTLDEVKQIRDLASAAEQYARAAKLGLEAQNHAAEIKLRAERKAGELLAQLERGDGGQPTHTAYSSNVGRVEVSEYRAVLDQTGTTRQDANRWQKIAELPEETFDGWLEQQRQAGEEITTTGVLRFATAPHVSYNAGEHEWYTPAEYIEAARTVMGQIDLDPASTEIANTVVQATHFYTAADNGLEQPWAGKVWMNPPYAQPLISHFVNKLADEWDAGNVTEAIVLVNNATETVWFHNLIYSASAVCFPIARVKFWSPDKVSAPLQGQAVIYLGSKPKAFAHHFRRFGWIGTEILP